MIVVIALLVALLVVVVGLVAVGSATGRLARQEPRSVFQLDVAVQAVADRLPAHVTAVISYAEVRMILIWFLDYLESRGVAGETDSDLESVSSGPHVADEDEALAYVIGRATDLGWDLDDAAIAEVIEACSDYLADIGAIGSEVPEPPDFAG